jgi:hypothetical protein
VVPPDVPLTPEADGDALLWLHGAGNVVVVRENVNDRKKLEELQVIHSKGILLKALDSGPDSEFELVFTRRNLKQYLYEKIESHKQVQEWRLEQKALKGEAYAVVPPPEQPHVVMLVSSVNSIESLGRSAAVMKKGSRPGAALMARSKGALEKLRALSSGAAGAAGGAARGGATPTRASGAAPARGPTPARGSGARGSGATAARVAPTPPPISLHAAAAAAAAAGGGGGGGGAKGGDSAPSFSTPHATAVGLAHYLSPLFASGAVVPFECIPVMLCSSIFNPSLLSVFSAFVSPWAAVSMQARLTGGARGGAAPDTADARPGGGGGATPQRAAREPARPAAPAALWGGAEMFLMPVPQKFHKKSFSELWVAACKDWHIIVVGLYRCRQNPLTRDEERLDAPFAGDPHRGDRDRGEYVFTAPPHDSLPLFAPPLRPPQRSHSLKSCDHMYFLVRDDSAWRGRLAEAEQRERRNTIGFALDERAIIGGR